jgi:uncharacterized protein with PQ loop repeat
VIRLSSTWYLIWNLTVFIFIFYSFLINLFTILIISVENPRFARDIPMNQISMIGNIVIPIIDMLFVRWRV